MGLGPPHRALGNPKNAARSNAQWFRTTVLWQQHDNRPRSKKVRNLPTTPPLDYASRIKIACFNVQNFAETLKLKAARCLMKEHHLGLIILTETKSTQYYSYNSEGYLIVLSGTSKDKHAGVGATVAPWMRPALLDVLQVSSRIIQLSFKKRGGNFHVIGTYAPHSGLDFEEVRDPYWESLEAQLEVIPQPEPVYITGDMNVRFQAKHRHDGDALGPFVSGKGAPYIDHTATSNRSLCIKIMQRNNMVEVASYKTPKMIQQITYKDKAAPPTDWSQFVMDPLVPQQFYGVVASKCTVGFSYQEFSGSASSFTPPKIQPQVDPHRFQRLDHCFTRKQWLSSVHSCRSKLYTGFPSDHYLLVSEVQVKLASRPKTAQQSRPDSHGFPNCTEASKEAFQKSVTAALLQQPTTQHTDHTAPVHYCTDGSGTAGTCTMKTPAGWGFCYVLEGVWHDAYRPVPTDPTHPLFAGAQVGSNNTGELTAILEALLHSIQAGRSNVFDTRIVHGL